MDGGVDKYLRFILVNIWIIGNFKHPHRAIFEGYSNCLDLAGDLGVCRNEIIRPVLNLAECGVTAHFIQFIIQTAPVIGFEVGNDNSVKQPERFQSLDIFLPTYYFGEIRFNFHNIKIACQ